MLPFRSGRSAMTGASGAVLLLAVLAVSVVRAQPQASPAEAKPKELKGFTPGAVPLPIGQEAKGLVLPDYDEEGRLRARLEAATAKRIDNEQIQFTGVKMTTYAVATNTPDLAIDMPASTLNIATRMINSTKRTTVTRGDFSIAGDTMRFDINTREGRLVGNVKMVISDTTELTKNLGE